MSIHFSSMYHIVRGMATYVKGVMALPPESKEKLPFFKLFFQDEEIAILADTLMEILPVVRENIKYKSKTDEKIRLVQLAEEIGRLREKLFPDIHFSILMSQKELEEIEIWSFRCEIVDSHSVPPWTYSYLDLILDELSRVDLIPKIQLQACSLSTDDKRVYLNLEWQGPFENIENLTILGISRQLWKVTCDIQDSPLSLNVMRYLLYLQVAIAWGDNEFIRGKVQQDGRLTASLQILQANSHAPHSELPLSEIAWQDVSNYVVQQSYPKYNEVSQKLELKLGEEFERRKKYAEQGLLENKYIDQIREWIDTLADFRQAYLEEISKVK